MEARVSEHSIFYQRLKEMIDSSGKSFNQIERELGYARNSLHNYQKVTKSPSASRLLGLAHYFGVSPEYLWGKDENVGLKSIETIFFHLTDAQKEEMALISQEWLLSMAHEAEKEKFVEKESKENN
jgi:transcriptional regulator with XRE-family HTH domain